MSLSVDCFGHQPLGHGLPEILAQDLHALLYQEPPLGFSQMVPVLARYCRKMLFHCAVHLLVSQYHHVAEVHLPFVVSYQLSVHFLFRFGQPTINGLLLCVTQCPRGSVSSSSSSCRTNTSSGSGCPAPQHCGFSLGFLCWFRHLCWRRISLHCTLKHSGV